MLLPFNIDIYNLPVIADIRRRHKTTDEYPVIIGIYKITSPNGAIYIGLSTDIYLRIYNNYKKIRCNRQQKIYNSLKKHGVENHTFEIIDILEEYDKDFLDWLEIYYISFFNSFSGDNDEFGLNLTMGGDSPQLTKETRKIIADKNRGKIVSVITRKKISKAHKGKKLSPEHREKIADANRGRKASLETRKKLSESHKRENLTAESLKNYSESKKGKKQSIETIAKRIEKMSGDNHWTKKNGGHTQETKDKISKSLTGKYVGKDNPMYGKKHTEEAKIKNRETHLGKKRSEESKKKQGDSIRGEKHHAYGKKFSDKHLKKLSESHKGIKPSEESRLKLSISLKAAWAKRKKRK